MNTIIEKILDIEQLNKHYPGVKALEDFCFDLFPGEIHSIVGHNGSGKSTFVKILGGAIPYDSGHIYFHNTLRPQKFSPGDVIESGIRVVYQDLAISPNLSILDNIFLGAETQKRGVIDQSKEKESIRHLISEYNLDFDVDLEQKAHRLSFAKMQLVEIIRALIFKPNILILDEPTSSLNLKEIGNFLGILKLLKAKGIGIIFISHKMDEVLEVSDRITVMKNGKNVWTKKQDEVKLQDIVTAMAGEAGKILKENPHKSLLNQDVVLDIKGLTKKDIITDFSYALKRGEIVSITGMKSDRLYRLARLILNIEKPDAGEINWLDGDSRKTFLDRKTCLIPEDRHKNSLFNKNSVSYNIGIPSFQKYVSNLNLIKYDDIDKSSRDFIKKVDLIYKSEKDNIQTLSSGNRQKAVLVRWLAFEADIFVIVEPTVGLDVESRFQLYNLFLTLTDQGKSIMLISTDVQEILYLSSTILVYKDELIVKQLDNTGLREADIYHYMLV
jgi:ribose transport system ATP-binding protein